MIVNVDIPDFEAQWSEEWDRRTKPLAIRRDGLRKQIGTLRKGIEDSKAYVERTEIHVEELGKLAGQALVDGQNSYSRYQTSLRKRTQELQDKKSEITALAKSLDASEKEFALAERHLNDEQDRFFREKTLQDQNDFSKGILEAVVLRYIDTRHLACIRLCARNREGFQHGFGEFLVNLKHDRFDSHFPGGVRLLSPEESLAAQKKPQEPAGLPLTVLPLL